MEEPSDALNDSGINGLISPCDDYCTVTGEESLYNIDQYHCNVPSGNLAGSRPCSPDSMGADTSTSHDT